MESAAFIKKKKPISKEKLKRNLIGWAIMLPSLILFAFFVWVPLLSNVVVSFYSDFDRTEFVGLENYKYIFNDSTFLTALANTFKYLFWSIVIGFFIPIFLGLLLSEAVHFRGFFRVMLYMPCMIAGIAVVFLFQKIYGAESYDILNVIFQKLNIPTQKWADDPNLVIPLIVIAMTWRGAGGTVLIYLSSIQTIDSTYYEAAKLDGANLWQRLFYVTLPAIKNTILTLFILQIISVFQVFYEPLVISDKGGPFNSSMTLMLLSYLYAYDKGEIAYGSATGCILALIIITFTLFYYYIINRINKKEQKL